MILFFAIFFSIFLVFMACWIVSWDIWEAIKGTAAFSAMVLITFLFVYLWVKAAEEYAEKRLTNPVVEVE